MSAGVGTNAAGAAEPPQHAGTANGDGPAGRAVTGRDVRAALGLAATGLLLAALAGAGYSARPLVVLAVVGAAAVTAVFPASPAPAGLCVVAVFLLLSGDVGFTAWLVVVASLLHTVHVLAGLGEVVPMRTRAEIGAFAPTFRRWLRTQLLTVPVLTVLVAVLS